MKEVLDSVRPARPNEGNVRHVKGSHIVVPRVHPEEHAYILQNADMPGFSKKDREQIGVTGSANELTNSRVVHSALRYMVGMDRGHAQGVASHGRSSTKRPVWSISTLISSLSNHRAKECMRS